MTDEITEADKVREHESKMEKIKSRAAAYQRSPFWFTIWDLSYKAMHVAFWLAFWSLVTQCTCGGCIWKP